MASFGVLAKLGVDASEMSVGLAKGKRSMQEFGNHIKKVVKVAVIAAGTSIAAFAAKGVGDFMKFEKKMAEVFTLIPNASRKMEQEMTADLRKLAKTMGIDIIEATEGLYSAISAGVPPDNALAFLEQASKLATAGVTDLKSAVGATTTVMNAYNLGIEDMGEISDTLFSIVQGGVTDMTELSKHIGKVTPVSSSLGISIQELAASARIMTKVFGEGNTPMAMTALKNGFLELGDAGNGIGKVFADLGRGTFAEFMKSGGSLQQALEMISDAAGGSESKLRSMFASKEAGTAIMALAADGAKKFGRELKAVGASAGSVETSWERMSRTASAAWDKIKSNLKDLGISVGAALAPLINQLAQVGTVTKKVAAGLVVFADVLRESPQMIKVIKGAIKLLLILLTSWGVIVVANAVKTGLLTLSVKAYNAVLIAATVAQKALNFAMKMSPARGLIAIMGALGAALVAFTLSNDEARERAEAAQKEINKEWEERKKTALAGIKAAKARIKVLHEEALARHKVAKMEKEGLTPLQQKLKLTREALQQASKEFNHARDTKKANAGRLVDLKKSLGILKEQIAETKRIMGMDLVSNEQAAEQLALEGRIAEITKEQLLLEEKILESSKELMKLAEQNSDLVQEAAEAAQRWNDAVAKLSLTLMKVHVDHQLSQTELGKIELTNKKIMALQREQEAIRLKILNKLEVSNEEIEKMAKNEKEVLQLQREIADVLEGKLKKALGEELEARKEKQNLLQQDIDAQKQLADKEIQRLETINKQLEAQRERVKEAEKEAGIFDKFRGEVDQFGQVKGVGALGLKSSVLRKEFLKQKGEGKLPEGVKTMRQFQRHIEEQVRIADQKLKDEIAKKKKLAQDQKDAIVAAEKALDKEAQLQKKWNEEQKLLVDMENKLLDRKDKTIKELTAERIKWEKAVQEFRKMAVGARPAGAPQLEGLMKRLGGQLGSLAQRMGHAAAPENQALFDMDMEKTEGELVGIHEEVKTLNATMKGKLVNDD